MDRSDVLKLIKTTQTQDDYGVWSPVETGREIFCRVNYVTRTEFFEAGRNGLNPEYMFTIFEGDYDGERVAEYNGLRYAIYRVYRDRTDTLELYAERQGGTNRGDEYGENNC